MDIFHADGQPLGPAPSVPSDAGDIGNKAGAHHLDHSKSRRRHTIIFVISMVVVLAIFSIGVIFMLHNDSGSQPQPLLPLASSVAPTPVLSDAGCTTFTAGEMKDPEYLEIPDLKLKSKVLIRGADEDGVAIPPPLNRSFDTAWYDKSPAVGSAKGNTILLIHSSWRRPTLGNNIIKSFEPGRIIKIVNKEGKVFCYRLTYAVKFAVNDFEPGSGIYLNDDGKPQLAMLTCADGDPDGVYHSRIIIYAEPIPPQGLPALDPHLPPNLPTMPPGYPAPNAEKVPPPDPTASGIPVSVPSLPSWAHRFR